jgi:hypothetical protein
MLLIDKLSTPSSKLRPSDSHMFQTSFKRILPRLSMTSLRESCRSDKNRIKTSPSPSKNYYSTWHHPPPRRASRLPTQLSSCFSRIRTLLLPWNWNMQSGPFSLMSKRHST